MNLDTVDGFIGGNVTVFSTTGRGFTPEELAEQALEKIVYVGSKSHPVIRCLLYTSPSPRDRQKSRMPSSA